MQKTLIFAALLMWHTGVFAFPVVQLTDGGQFTNYSTITNEVDKCTKVINFDNVAIIRKIEDDTLLVDGKINIKFSGAAERNAFVDDYYKYVTTAKPPQVIKEVLIKEEEHPVITKVMAWMTIVLSLASMYLIGPAVWADIKERWKNK